VPAIEDRLRDSLAYQVRVLRIGDDMAGAAIRSARTIRRRRLASAAVACAVAMVTVACVRPTAGPAGDTGTEADGTGQLGSVAVTTASPSPQPSAAPAGVRLDVYDAADQLRTTDGRTYDLSGSTIHAVVRVAVGWLLFRSGDGRTWLLRPDGTTITLRARVLQGTGGEQPGRPAISADGQRIAWVDGTSVYAARLTPLGEQDVVGSPIGLNAFALTWIGSRVVLGQTYEPGCCGYNHAQYDVWDPARGNFVPQWTKGLSPIFGPVPEGRPAFAAQQIAPPALPACLVRLDGVRDLSVTAKACPTGLVYGSLQSLLAPDGRHLLDQLGETAAVFDLDTVVPAGTPSTTCPTGSPIAWEDAANVIIDSDARGFVRCNITTTAVTDLPPDLGRGAAQTRVVPRYGP
jgi:hypothetical protein